MPGRNYETTQKCILCNEIGVHSMYLVEYLNRVLISYMLCGGALKQQEKIKSDKDRQ